MRPSLSVHDLVNGVMAYAKLCAERASRNALRACDKSDEPDLFLGQPCGSTALPKCSRRDRWRSGAMSVPNHHVSHVVGLASQIQVVRPDAEPIVAMVQNVATFRNQPVRHLVGEPMRAHGVTITTPDPKDAVFNVPHALSGLRNPEPAFTRTINVSPEASGDIRVKRPAHIAGMITPFIYREAA